MRGLFRLQVFLYCSLFALGISLSAWAQSAISTGAISGTVADPSGAAIVGAAITATDVATGTSRAAKTNGAGFYSFPSLNVGTYNVTVSHPGFKTTEIKDIVVQIGQSVAANATLEVGAVTQTVTVTGETPLLRATEPTVSTVVSQDLIQALPLSGRRYTDFVLLTPNTNADGDFGLVSIGGQQGGADSGYANGNGSNSFTVDGATATSNYFGEARGRTRVPYVFGEQSIQEFQVADNPYEAAYGGGGSGFVNTVTKSGGDTFHGDAFYYNRNSGIGNANDAVDNAAGRARPLDILQQFGADLGGPIVHHKAWFYFDYEQQRRKEPISIVIPGNTGLSETDFGVPSGTTLPAPNGVFPAPANFAPTPPFSYSALTASQQAEYLQGVSNALNAINSNLNLRKRLANNLSFFPKVDWQPASADHFTFAYNYSKFDSPGGEYTFNPVNYAGDSYLGNNFVRDHHATTHWTHTFGPTLLNDFHVSFTRDEQLSTPSGLIPSTLPQVALNSSSPFNPSGFPQFMYLGNANYLNADTREYQWQINERLSYVAGRHTLDFGFDFDRTHVTDFYAGNFDGSYSFNNATSFALGEYHSFLQSIGNPLFPFTFPYYGFYAQDKFQATKRLTLNFGLREDFQVYPQPQKNGTLGPVIARLTGQFPNQYQRLSPRFGLAWQPLEKTVVRGGFGIFREVFNAINYENSVTSNGLRTASTFQSYNSGAAPNAQTPTFPNALPSTAPVFSSSSNLSIVSPDFQTPYILESSLEIQREVLPNTTLTIGTMWTHGTHLIASSAYDLNLIPPTGTTTYIVCPPGAGSSPSSPVSTAVCTGPSFTGRNLDSGLLTEGRLIPTYSGQINALISPGNNNYNSFYVKFQQRNFHGLSTLLSYTFSKGLQSNGADFNNQFDFSNTRGPSLLDQRHRLSIAAFYSPGAPSFANAFGRTLLSDWTISTVMQFNSGRPYAALLSGACSASDFTSCVFTPNNNLNDSAFNESTGNTATGIAGSGPSPFVGYNAFYGPWIDEIDLGLSRRFHITERQTLSVTAQVFNLFNHPNFFVQDGGGIIQVKYNPIGPNCGDGATSNQMCFLVPNSGPGGFKTLGSINELNGPRTFQFALAWKF